MTTWGGYHSHSRFTDKEADSQSRDTTWAKSTNLRLKLRLALKSTFLTTRLSFLSHSFYIFKISLLVELITRKTFNCLSHFLSCSKFKMPSEGCSIARGKNPQDKILVSMVHDNLKIKTPIKYDVGSFKRFAVSEILTSLEDLGKYGLFLFLWILLPTLQPGAFAHSVTAKSCWYLFQIYFRFLWATNDHQEGLFRVWRSVVRCSNSKVPSFGITISHFRDDCEFCL